MQFIILPSEGQFEEKQGKSLLRAEVSEQLPPQKQTLEIIDFLIELTWTAVFPITQANLIPGSLVYSSLRALI